jgi:hypothetical protein
MGSLCGCCKWCLSLPVGGCGGFCGAIVRFTLGDLHPAFFGRARLLLVVALILP